VRPEYDSTVGKAVRFQIEYNGKQPGDPAKAAQVIRQVAEMDDPPVRLLLGSDVVGFVEKADLKKSDSDKKWRGPSFLLARGRFAIGLLGWLCWYLCWFWTTVFQDVRHVSRKRR